MLFKENIIPSLSQFLDEGHRIAIATLIGIDGSSPRPIGSQIGVCEDGRFTGMITAGCAEKALIAETVACMASAENRIVRYGKGSPYIDVVLPCGSGIDIYIETVNAQKIVKEVSAALACRETAILCINLKNKESKIVRSGELNHCGQIFIKHYEPDYLVLAFGEGSNLATFSTIANAAGFDVVAFSPDQSVLDYLAQQNIPGRAIFREMDLTNLPIDQYSALVTLFHEHAWEIRILHAALNSDVDYVGALGSRRTHALRLDQLNRLAVRRPLELISGPVGLEIGAQNPSEISIAILAELIAHRRLSR